MLSLDGRLTAALRTASLGIRNAASMRSTLSLHSLKSSFSEVLDQNLSPLRAVHNGTAVNAMAANRQSIGVSQNSAVAALATSQPPDGGGPVNSPVQPGNPCDTTAADDAYWAAQPPAVQQLRDMQDFDQRKTVAANLAAEGYTIDVPIMVWGWDPSKTMQARQSYGYTWVPSALQAPVTAAPGITAPGLTPYDASNPPAGSISV